MISYESQGSMSYKVASSEAHVLEKMPNCTYCGAVKFEYESPTFCCDNGKVKLVHVEVPDKLQGVYTFRAQGMVYHDLPGLLPDEKGPNPFQLYFIETENEDYPSVKDIQLHISKDVKLDQRVYNSPTADQVAAIWVEGNDGDIPFERDIIVYSHSGHRHRIKHYYGCNDPRQYPILFPRVDNPNHGDVPTVTSFSSANDVLSKENEGVTAVKYLYKYIYKGHDKVAIHFSPNDDENLVGEIKQFQDARCVSTQEAMWRIFEFNLNEIDPAVIKLQLHLPNQQSVTYWANQRLDNILRWDHVSKTMLTDYFSMCSKSENARKYLYREFPEHYVWDKQDRCWRERKKRDVIGRISGVNPIEGERYYLRLLLNHIRGSTSFQDLVTVNGVAYSSFKQVAQKRGLLESY
ncbi:hypothetical protein Sango_2828900 [Sesamum angolense]|uniref:Uncharacterized protein n=1 Tax=Sesamum angolense TaxID=2727404 RepID=A0AAE1T879_9LAMI|nr:hypothetical protein Sango_2828900 [Sesamum angolense]